MTSTKISFYNFEEKKITGIPCVRVPISKYSELVQIIKTNAQCDDFIIRYKDDENDQCIIQSDAELNEAVGNSATDEPLQLAVVLPFKTKGSFGSPHPSEENPISTTGTKVLETVQVKEDKKACNDTDTQLAPDYKIITVVQTEKTSEIPDKKAPEFNVDELLKWEKRTTLDKKD